MKFMYFPEGRARQECAGNLQEDFDIFRNSQTFLGF